MNKNNKYFKLLLYIFLVAGITSLPASSAAIKSVNSQYSNNLLGIKLKKSEYESVSVNVITAKPYKIKLLPIQRSNNEYLIFLPETFHSITSKPDFSDFKNIKDVEVSLVPNLDANSNNGYTKITIKTNSSEQLIDVINTTLKPTNVIDLDLERLLATQKEVKPPRKIAQNRSKPKKIKKQAKKYTKPTVKIKKTISSKPKQLKTIVIKDLPAKKATKAINKPVKINKVPTNITKSNTKPKARKVKKEQTLVKFTKIDEKKLDTKTEKKEFSVDKLIKVNHIDFAAIHSNIFKYLNYKTISENFKMKYLFLIIAILALFEIIKYIIKQLKIDADKEFDKTKQANKIINKSKNIYNNNNQKNQQRNTKRQPESSSKDIQIDDFIDTVSSKKSGYFTSPISNNQEDPIEKEFKILNKFNKETPEISFKSVSEKLFADSFNQVGFKKPSSRRPTRASASQQNRARQSRAAMGLQNRPNNPLDQLIVLDGVQITEQRGLYVVRLEDKKALVGIISSEVFILKIFNESKNPIISIKKTAGKPLNQDVFYVQVGDWKGVVTSNAQKFDLEMSF